MGGERGDNPDVGTANVPLRTHKAQESPVFHERMKSAPLPCRGAANVSAGIPGNANSAGKTLLRLVQNNGDRPDF